MDSTLIRFTSSKYVDSYRKGDLYLSSLWTFWDFMDNKFRYEDIGKVTEEEIKKAIEQNNNRRNDFSEGVAAQIPRDQVTHLFETMGEHIIHDVRFRLSAYKYCNLMCFYRIDAEDGDRGYLDEGNAALLLQKKGKNITVDELKSMNQRDAQLLVESVIEKNHVLSPSKTHLVQLPAPSMDSFGDIVVVIKNEEEFKRRVLEGVKKAGGHLVMGDVRYHALLDRVDSGTMNRNSITLVSSENPNGKQGDRGWLTGDGTFRLKDIENANGVIWRGCLDKYDIFGIQREWRICWLPKELDYNAKTLSVGSLEDIIEFVKTSDIREYLLKKYKGYAPGIITRNRKVVDGTETYMEFKERMKRIDGLGDFIMEIG